MSDISLAVRKILLDDPDVSALVGDSIFTDHMPQGLPLPSLVLWTITSTGEDCLNGPIGFEQAIIQLECNAAKREDSNAIWLKTLRALGGYRGRVLGCLIRSIAQNTGHYHREDRPLQGTDQYRFVTIQDWSVNYVYPEGS